MSTSGGRPTLRSLVAAIESGELDPQRVREAAISDAKADAEDLRAWVELLDPAAPSSLDSPGPLAGVPIGVKDIIDVAGLPTRCGSVLRADAPPAAADAAIVSAWRAAGGSPIGKTVTTEFAYFAPGPTRNPAAPGHTPGGSSSGSAAAVASGQVPLATGSQTAGSVTRPASFCGVAALVMTRGRFANDGVTGLAESLDAHGVFAASVSDLALAWSALTGEPDAGLAASVREPRILLWEGLTTPVVEPAMRAALDRARLRLRADGADVDDLVDAALVDGLARQHHVVMAYEAARSRAEELRQQQHLSAPLAELLSRGAATSTSDYEAALRDVDARGAALSGLTDGYDVILGPAALGPAPAGLDATGDPALSRPWQVLGLPAVTVPGLVDPGGLPLGVQLVGRAGQEAQLLEVAAWVESRLQER